MTHVAYRMSEIRTSVNNQIPQGSNHASLFFCVHLRFSACLYEVQSYLHRGMARITQSAIPVFSSNLLA
jgi:hypothetical protein